MGEYRLNNHNTFDREKDGESLKVAINSIQRTLFVERLHVPIAYPKDQVIPYDVHNLYPQIAKSIAERSGTTSIAIRIMSRHLFGAGFDGMEQIVNREGKTLAHIMKFMDDQFCMFNGFALHFNYNLLGEITEINPVNFEFVRWNKYLNGFVVDDDWARRRRKSKHQKEYPIYNPDNVLNEIEMAGGIENYEGQLLYWIPNISDIYTTCYWDSVLDDAQFEAEDKLYGLSTIQNDYSLSGFATIPFSLQDDEQIEELKKDLRGDVGSGNAGGIRVISGLPADLQNYKFFTPISRNNIDNLHTNQITRAKFNIYHQFGMPPILSGVSESGMFNEASYADAFHYYNSETQQERLLLQQEMNKILSRSIWNIDVEIMPLEYQERTKTVEK